LIEQEITTVSIVHPNFRENFQLPSRAAVTVRRSAFDAYLVRLAGTAGAEVWDSASISKVGERDDGVHLTVDGRAVETKILIIAEGATSRTASALFGPYPGDHQGIGVAMTCRLDRDPGGRMEFHLLGTPIERFPFRFQYPLNGWLFATRNGANIGVTGKDLGGEVYRKALEDLRRNVEERYGPAIETRTSAHPIPMTPRPRLNTRRCMLIGDAAGLASPMSGEGMTNAFKSAALAARAAWGFIENGTPLTSYRRGVAADILPILRASRALSPPVQWLIGVVNTPVLMSKMHADPEIVSTCFRISRGEEQWSNLLGLIVRRFPYLFFSSLS
jgi:flavin-dependent dehydrogenase